MKDKIRFKQLHWSIQAPIFYWWASMVIALLMFLIGVIIGYVGL